MGLPVFKSRTNPCKLPFTGLALIKRLKEKRRNVNSKNCFIPQHCNEVAKLAY
jgi:hypothetical protein